MSIMGVLYTLWAAVLLVPPIVIAAQCMGTVVRAPLVARKRAFRVLCLMWGISLLALIALIFLASAMAGATGNRADVNAAFVWMAFRSGLFLSVAGCLASILVARLMVRNGDETVDPRWVMFAPIPFVALSPVVAGYTGMTGG